MCETLLHSCLGIPLQPQSVSPQLESIVRSTGDPGKKRALTKSFVGIYHPTGEISVASVAQELNLPYCLSSAGSYSIEDVGEANGGGTRFFQLYQSPDDEQALSMLERAHKSGFTACILTADTWQLAWRHHDVFQGNYAFYHEHGAGDIGLNDPVFMKRVEEAGLDPKKEPKKVGAKWMDENIWYVRSCNTPR